MSVYFILNSEFTLSPVGATRECQPRGHWGLLLPLGSQRGRDPRGHLGGPEAAAAAAVGWRTVRRSTGDLE